MFLFAVVCRIAHSEISIVSAPDDLAVGKLGTRLQQNVPVRIISEFPRIWTARPDIKLDARLRIDRRADSGFAEIICRSPGEITDHMVIAHDKLPDTVDLQREGFRSADHTVREAFVILFVTVFHIVVAADINRSHQAFRTVRPDFTRISAVGVLERTVVAAAGDFGFILVAQTVPKGAVRKQRRTGGVERADFLRQLAGEEISVPDAGALEHFIADRPDDDAGMIDVALDVGRDVALPPVVEEKPVVMRCFVDMPSVKSLIDHKDSVFVAEIQELRGRRIVGRADRVVSGVLMGFQQSTGLAFKISRAERTRGMMHAAALEFDGFAVDPQAVDCVDCDGPDAETSRGRIDAFTGGQIFGTFFEEGRVSTVQCGMILVPDVRMRYNKTDPGRDSFAGICPDGSPDGNQ